MSTSAFKMVRDRETGLKRPGFRWELADDFWPLAQAGRFETRQGLGVNPLRRRPRGLGNPSSIEMGPYALPPAGACPAPLPGQGCAPSGKAVGMFGFHANVTNSTTGTERNTRPDMDVRGQQIVAGGTELQNWLITSLKVNQNNAILHGDACPASIFAPWSRHPVMFDLALARGADKMTCNSRVMVSSSLGGVFLGLGLQTCFESQCWPSHIPCARSPIVKEGTRQVIVGLGNGSQVQDVAEASTATLVGKTSQDTLLGNLILEAVMYNSPEDLPDPGLTAANGCRGLGWVEVVEFNIQGVLVYTSNPDTGSNTSAISGMSFGAEAAGMFTPDIIANSSEALNVQLKNRAPATASTATENGVRVAGGFVGCMLA